MGSDSSMKVAEVPEEGGVSYGTSWTSSRRRLTAELDTLELVDLESVNEW